MLLHVIDASDPHHGDRRRQVETVLEEIGAGDVPCIQVYNKIDRTDETRTRELNGSASAKIWVSAATGEGLGELSELIRVHCVGRRVTGRLQLGPRQSRLRSKLFDLRAVRAERTHESGGWTLDVELTSRRWKELCNQEGLSEDSFERVQT